jgi:hypothetical protein
LGYWSSDCSSVYDINRGSRGIGGVVFYSACAIAFLIASIIQFRKMERSNPVAMIMLFVFSALNLASAVIILREKKSTNLSDFFMMLSVSCMAYAIQRGIILILDQFKATTEGLRYTFLHWSLYVIPAVIALFSAVAAFQLEGLRFWLTLVPFVACSIWTFLFSLVALYTNMQDAFEKMDSSFPNLAAEVRNSRAYLSMSSAFFIPMTISVAYNVNADRPIFGTALFLYYFMIVVEIFCLSAVGLSNDAILSDLFAVEDEPRTDQRLLPFDGEIDEQSPSSLSASLNPAVLMKTAERKIINRMCWEYSLRITGALIVVAIITGSVLLCVIRPSDLVWVFETVGPERFDGSVFAVEPRVTLRNSMRVAVNVSLVVLDVFFRGVSLGRAEVDVGVVKGRSDVLIGTEMSLNMSGAMGAGIPPDGVVNLELAAEAWTVTMNVFAAHAFVRCQQSVRLLPAVEIAWAKGRCVSAFAETSIDL